MSWRTNTTDTLADWLRFMVLACGLVSGFALSLGGTYIVLKFTWYFIRFLDRTVFGAPW